MWCVCVCVYMDEGYQKDTQYQCLHITVSSLLSNRLHKIDTLIPQHTCHFIKFLSINFSAYVRCWNDVLVTVPSTATRENKPYRHLSLPPRGTQRAAVQSLIKAGGFLLLISQLPLAWDTLFHIMLSWLLTESHQIGNPRSETSPEIARAMLLP